MMGGSGGNQQSPIFELIAPILLLIAPFVGFLKYHEYSVFTVEVAVAMSAIIAFGAVLGALALLGGRFVAAAIGTALLVFFIDFGFDGLIGSGKWLAAVVAMVFLGFYVAHNHIAQIITAVFATIVVSTLVLMVTETTAAQSTQERSSTGTNNLPIVVHLILDEHIGLDGFPMDIQGADDLRTVIRSVYQRNHFALLEAAYGEYYNTFNALGHLQNLAPDHQAGFAKSESLQQWRLTENKYLEQVAALGFRIAVYQSSYLDSCPESQMELRCTTYRYDRLSPIQSAALPLGDKAYLIARAYLDTAAKNSTIRREVRQLYERARSGSKSVGELLPMWRIRSTILTAPMESFAVLERLKSEIANAKSGDFFMAHLLIPHAPYVYDSECNLKRASEWVNKETELTAEARRELYRKYFEQVACLYKHLDRFFSDLTSQRDFENVVVIVHGDHGSRITLTDLFGSNGTSDMPPSDYVDAFSTLFAVKIPGQEPIVSHEPVSVNYLVREMLRNKFSTLPSLDDPAADPGVYVTNDSRQMVRKRFSLVKSH